MTILPTTERSRGLRGLLTPGSRATRAEFAWNLITLVVMLAAVSMRTAEPHSPGTATVAFVFASWIPLTVRTRWPELVLVVVVLIEMTYLFAFPDLGTGVTGDGAVGAYQPVPLGTMVAVFTVASRRRNREAWAVGTVAALALVVAALVGQDQPLVGTVLVMVELVVVATGTGVAVRLQRELRERRAHDATEQARKAVLRERLRIARELHDTLAHNLALIDAQAGVADYLLESDPTAAHAALRGITTHTGSAIEDLRATLQLLRSDERPGAPDDGIGDPTNDADAVAPVVGLGQLTELIERVRLTGTAVELTVEGQPVPLLHQTDLAAYRIIQEALTNATKHAPSAQIDVDLGWDAELLQIEVRNTAGRAARPVSPSGTGHGLVGLRERARVAGGTLTSGPTADGGYRLRADLPIGRPSESEPQPIPPAAKGLM